MQLYFATKNLGKVASVGRILSNYGIEIVQVPLELPEPRSDDLHIITKDKVIFAYKQLQNPCITQDSGFYIPALKGFPKAFVNFTLETIGLEGILKLAEGKPKGCEFRNCLAYLDGSISEPKYFESITRGNLANTPRGELKEHQWSELWLIFIPQDQNKTIAEMTDEEYSAWRALRDKESFAAKFAEWLQKRKIL